MENQTPAPEVPAFEYIGPVNQNAPASAPAAAPASAPVEPTPPAAPATTETPATPAPPETPPAALPSPYQALGLEENDFTKKLIAAAKSEEDFRVFAKQMSTDYKAMSDADLLLMDTRKLYPTLNDEQLQTQLELRLQQEFSQGDDFSDKMQDLGRAKMEALANKLRDDYEKEVTAWQPTAVPAPPAAPAAPDPEAVRRETDAILAADPFMAQFEANPVLRIGEGEAAMDYKMSSPDAVRKYAYDPSALIEDAAFIEVDGKRVFSAAKWARLVAYATDMDGYDKALLDSSAKAQFNKGYVPPTHTTAGASGTPNFEYIGPVRR